MEAIVVSPADAATMLATSPNRVHELIKEGSLKAYRDGKNYKIPIVFVHEYANTRAEEETERRKNDQ